MARRIAMARLFQETNALSPVPTEASDFARFETHGQQLLEGCRRRGAEIPGIWHHAELTGFCAELRRALPDAIAVPLFSAFAVPGGKLPRPVFDGYVERLVDGLRAAAPLDGVYLVLHGAMGAEGVDDPEGALLQAVRAALGPELPLVVSFDLHGFLTRARVEACSAILAYRTFPHRDHADIGARAARILAGMVAGAVRPVQSWRTLPMILGGAPNVDFLQPMRPVFRRLAALDRAPKVLGASVLCCQPWHDAPGLGWSVCVVTDGDRAQGEALADELADALWGVRRQLPPEVPGPEEAIDRARSASLRRRLGTVCLADTSDAVGAGAPGENTAVLRALLERGGDLRAAVPVRDALAVERLWGQPVGAAVELELGGRLAPSWYEPYGVRGTIVSKWPTTRLGGRAVVLRCGQASVVVASDAPVAIGPAFYTDVGLSPWRHDVCVVKSWMGFRLEYLWINRLSLWARTRGVTDLDAMREVTYDVPVHPFADLADWREADRLRRLA